VIAARLLLIALLLALTGCGGGCARSIIDSETERFKKEIAGQTGDKSEEDTTPFAGGDAFLVTARWIGGLGGLALALGVLGAIGGAAFGIAPLRNIGGHVAAGGVMAILSASVLSWIGDNYWLILLVCILGGSVYWLVHCKGLERLEKKLGWDLNRDGKIGTAKVEKPKKGEDNGEA